MKKWWLLLLLALCLSCVFSALSEATPTDLFPTTPTDLTQIETLPTELPDEAGGSQQEASMAEAFYAFLPAGTTFWADSAMTMRLGVTAEETLVYVPAQAESSAALVTIALDGIRQAWTDAVLKKTDEASAEAWLSGRTDVRCSGEIRLAEAVLRQERPAPGKPTMQSAVQRGQSSVHLCWSAAEGCDGYELYRSEGGAWKRIKTVSGTETDNYSLLPGTVYRYRVRGYALAEGGRIMGEESDEIAFSLSVPKAPEGLTVQRQGRNGALLSWQEVPEADAYIVYRAADGGTETALKTVEEAQALCTGLTEGAAYTFRVAAVVSGELVRLVGERSEPAAFALTPEAEAPKNVTVRQSGANRAVIEWDAVPGAEEYALLRAVGNGPWQQIKSVTETQAGNYSLAPGQTYSYCVRVKRMDGRSVSGTDSQPCQVTILFPEAPQKLTVRENAGHAILEWEAVPGADCYAVYRSVDGGEWKRFNTVTGLSVSNRDVSAEQSYRYRVTAIMKMEGFQLESIPSNEAAFRLIDESEVTRRALVIGEAHYQATLHGPEQDVPAMQSILSRFGYKVFAEMDARRQDVLGLIETAFRDAKETDISLFYYSGHGVTGAGDAYAGALQLVDDSYITMEELAKALAKVPGRVIVVLDSCGSGAAIESGISAKALFDPVSFNSSVVSAFAAQDSFQPRSGEMRQSKFYVLTGSAYEQNSVTVFTGGVWGGVLTRGISEAVGRVFSGGAWNAEMPADTDADGAVTLSELYGYCRRYASERQNVRVYPSGSTMKVFIQDPQ